MNDTMLGVESAEKKEKKENVDFKMVSFCLAGKDYGIDIMNVKEIAKAGKFTYVPNAAPFLRGVYNLRGDIIPVIDLRVFFHLPAERKSEDALESMLILRIDDHVFGVIVDTIDKVVGIASNNIQPPHPIFGDINIKYIRGVVENLGHLYIILDVVRIFSPKEEEKPQLASVANSNTLIAPSAPRTEQASASSASSELEFISEALFALKRFATTALNEDWLAARFAEWNKTRKGNSLQLKHLEDAEEFLDSFYSPYSSRFWEEEYAEAVYAALPDIQSKTVHAWNPGCGKGYETFSFAAVLKRRYPEARVKIWANDNDLLAISSAPNMVFEFEEVPDYLRALMVKGRNGYSFDPSIKESIMFEYHDVLNANPFPELDIVLARDLLSFLSPSDQAKVFEDFSDKLKSNGIVILGRNEKLVGQEWRSISTDPVSAFMRDM
ncbi:chemotaxis protein CheW [Treponema sp.]